MNRDQRVAERECPYVAGESNFSRAGPTDPSKAARWSATNSRRLEPAPGGTLVVGQHLGLTGTRVNSGNTAPMNDAADIVGVALDGIETGRHEILADDISAAVKHNLATPIKGGCPGLCGS